MISHVKMVQSGVRATATEAPQVERLVRGRQPHAGPTEESIEEDSRQGNGQNDAWLSTRRWGLMRYKKKAFVSRLRGRHEVKVAPVSEAR